MTHPHDSLPSVGETAVQPLCDNCGTPLGALQYWIGARKYCERCVFVTPSPAGDVADLARIDERAVAACKKLDALNRVLGLKGSNRTTLLRARDVLLEQAAALDRLSVELETARRERDGCALTADERGRQIAVINARLEASSLLLDEVRGVLEPLASIHIGVSMNNDAAAAYPVLGDMVPVTAAQVRAARDLLARLNQKATGNG